MINRSSHFINGSWLNSEGQAFNSINPATNSLIWEGNEATNHEIQLALNAARKAFRSWSQLSISQRIEYLYAFARRLKKNQDALAVTISQETGKPLWEAKTEVVAMINKIAISVEAYTTRCSTLVTKQNSGSSIINHRPHGIMGVLGPYNFPGHIPNGHIIPALLAGNTVIFKPSELTPLVAEMTMKCWQESGIPEGVINLIQGGMETGQLLSRSLDLDGLLFTGSWQTGKHLSEFYAQTPYKILALEMGGNNPFIVSNVSDTTTAAYLTIQSTFLTSGQRCSCARRLIVPSGTQGDKFIDDFVEMTKKIKVGLFTDDPEPFMGPVISEKVALNILKKQENLMEQGGIPLLKGTQLSQSSAFLSPSIIDVTSLSQREDVEIFGPLVQIIRVPNFSSAIQEANTTHYGLAAGLLSDLKEEYTKFSTEIKAGVINWNVPLTGASSSAPFGGIKQSGNNRPSAYYAADYCAYPVASIENPTLEMPSKITPGIDL